MNFAGLNRVARNVFGERFTLRRTDQADATLRGVFDSRHFVAEPGAPESANGVRQSAIGVSILVTTLTVLEADVGSVDDAAQIDIRGLTYRIADRRPDGQGMVVWELELIEDES